MHFPSKNKIKIKSFFLSVQNIRIFWFKSRPFLVFLYNKFFVKFHTLLIAACLSLLFLLVRSRRGRNHHPSSPSGFQPAKSIDKEFWPEATVEPNWFNEQGAFYTYRVIGCVNHKRIRESGIHRYTIGERKMEYRNKNAFGKEMLRLRWSVWNILTPKPPCSNGDEVERKMR